VIITLLGWAAVINGAVRVLVPDRATKLGKKLLGYNFTMAPRRSGSSSAPRSATSVFARE
jgi:hypothetical protein